MSAGLPLPRQVFAHGFVYNKGAKISKSAGTAIDPMDVFRVHGADAFRYYFMSECPFGGDGNFSDERFAEVYNADLANNLGNLYSRTLSMCVKYFDGRLDGSAAVDPDRLAGRPRPRGAGGRPARARRDVPVQRRAATHLARGARRRQPLHPGDRALQAGQDRPRGLQGRPGQPGRGLPRGRHPDQAVPARDRRRRSTAPSTSSPAAPGTGSATATPSRDPMAPSCASRPRSSAASRPPSSPRSRPRSDEPSDREQGAAHDLLHSLTIKLMRPPGNRMGIPRLLIEVRRDEFPPVRHRFEG